MFKDQGLLWSQQQSARGSIHLFTQGDVVEEESRSLMPKFLTAQRWWSGTTTTTTSTGVSQPSSEQQLPPSRRWIPWATAEAAPATNSTWSNLMSAPERQMTRYTNFAISFAVGVGFLFLAFMFLPMVVLAPQKFALLFTLGSLFILNSLALLKGYQELLAHFAKRERLPLSVLYLSSILLTLFATLRYRSYLLTLVAAGVQLLALVSFLFSYLAGSSYTLSLLKNMVTSLFRGGAAGPVILPL